MRTTENYATGNFLPIYNACTDLVAGDDDVLFVSTDNTAARMPFIYAYVLYIYIYILYIFSYIPECMHTGRQTERDHPHPLYKHKHKQQT